MRDRLGEQKIKSPWLIRRVVSVLSSRHPLVSSGLSLGLLISMILGAVPIYSSPGSSNSANLTEDQKIIHVLNRLGYGPRPGDLERVKKIGLNNYIDQQLNPERIDDSATQARLTGLTSLHMTIGETYQKYPQPQMVQNKLGLGRRALIAGNNNSLAGAQANAANQNAGNGSGNAVANNAPGAAGAQAADSQTQAEQREINQKVRNYYIENGLKNPQALLVELQAQKLIRATYSERQLQEVMTDFWFNHFNIFWGKGADRWMTTDFEMNVIRPHTMGKFKDLLLATAQSPAMLFYLDNFQSSSPNAVRPGGNGQGGQRPVSPNRIGQVGNRPPGQAGGQMPVDPKVQQAIQQFQKRKPGINENYAREIMELHTLGVDGGYTQKDVTEVARCLTGWTIDRPQIAGSFIFRPFMHDPGEKVVLGHKIDAGGIKDGEEVIDLLAHSPSTAKFISTKLVRRFVSDTPPQSLVDKVAGVYMKSDGDIRAMLKTIFTSPEFYSAQAFRSKVKSPFELAISAIRGVNGDTDGSPRLAQFIARIGEPLYQYQAPTGYPDRADQWVNTGALLERLNFGLALGANRILGTTVDAKRVAQSKDSEPAHLMDQAIALLLYNNVSASTRSILNKQLIDGPLVNGELKSENRAAAMGDGINGANGDGEMRVGNQPPNGANGQIRQAGFGGGRGLGNNFAGNLTPPPPVDPQVAKVIGLVLGSPEFQQR